MFLLRFLILFSLTSHLAFAQSGKEELVRRLEANIERGVDDNQPGLSKDVTAKGDVFAAYAKDCRTKVGIIGTNNYPDEARGKLYGTAVVTFEVLASGEILAVTVDQSSGHHILDAAAVQTVQQSSPFPPFTGELKRRADILVITSRIAFFASGDKYVVSVSGPL